MTQYIPKVILDEIDSIVKIPLSDRDAILKIIEKYFSSPVETNSKMTHTLHPDTLIARIMEEVEIFWNHSPVCVNDKVIRFVKIDEWLLKSIISKHVLPPSQHLKDDEYLDKEFSKWYDAWVKAARDKIAELEQ